MVIPSAGMEQEMELVQAFKAGDMLAFEKIFKAYYPLLLKVGQFYLENRNDAEEVVQDLFFGLWEKRAQLDIRKTMKGYHLYAVKNKCLNHIRKKKVMLSVSEEDHDIEAGSSYTADAVIRARQTKELIDQALDKLPEQCRLIFLMHRQDQFTYKEIAELLDLSPKTVENQIGKALKILQAELKGLFAVVLITWFTQR